MRTGVSEFKMLVSKLRTKLNKDFLKFLPMMHLDVLITLVLLNRFGFFVCRCGAINTNTSNLPTLLACKLVYYKLFW